MPRSPGRAITYEDRQRARALISKVDAKIKAGLLAITPYEPCHWSSGSNVKRYGLSFTPAGDPRPHAPRAKATKTERRLFD